MSETKTLKQGGCDVCGYQSGGREVGVAAVPGAPVSLMWCDNCLREQAIPRFVVEVWLFQEFWEGTPMPCEPPEQTLASWALEQKVWMDDGYMTIREALPVLWRNEYENPSYLRDEDQNE